jgi:hypothetical protein
MPVLLAKGEPHHVTRTALLDRATPALCEAAASRHNQSLAQRVGVPRRPRARLGRKAGALNECRIGGLE